MWSRLGIDVLWLYLLQVDLGSSMIVDEVDFVLGHHVSLNDFPLRYFV